MRNIAIIIVIALILAPISQYNAVGDTIDRYQEGIKLFNEGQYDKSIEALSAAVKSNPNDPVKLLTLGIALANSKRYDDAIKQFKEVTKLLPGESVPYFLLEGSYLGKGMSDEARNVRKTAEQKLTLQRNAEGRPDARNSPFNFQSQASVQSQPGQLAELLASHTNNAIAQNLLGDIYQVRGMYPQAISCYRRATELAKGWIKPWFNLGMANLVVNPAEATEDFKKVIELDPKNLHAQLWLGDAYVARQDYTSALEAYGNAAASPKLSAAARSRMGNVYLKQNNPQQAEQEFKVAAEQAPEDPVPVAGLGDALKQQQRYEESAKAYQRASDLTKSSPMQTIAVVPNLANAYMEKGDYRKAIDELKKVIALNPTFNDPIPMLVDAYQRGGLLQEGISEYEAVLNKNPHDTAAMRFLVTAYARSGNAQGRAKIARKLIKYLPDESPVWNKELGAALVMLKDQQGAFNAFKEGLEANPLTDYAGIIGVATSAGMLGDLISHYEKASSGMKDVKSLLILANIREALGDYKKAVILREKLVELYPENQQYWIMLGDDLIRSGNADKAKNVFRKAATMDNLQLRIIAEDRIKNIK